MVKMKDVIKKFVTKQSTIDQLEPVVVDLGELFNDMLYELWKSLMTIEMTLYEQCEVCALCPRHIYIRQDISYFHPTSFRRHVKMRQTRGSKPTG